MYAQPDFWKSVVRELSDETLREWISYEKDSIPKLKELASHGDKDSPIYVTIEMAELDLSLYEGELGRRLAQKPN